MKNIIPVATTGLILLAGVQFSFGQEEIEEDRKPALLREIVKLDKPPRTDIATIESVISRAHKKKGKPHVRRCAAEPGFGASLAIGMAYGSKVQLGAGHNVWWASNLGMIWMDARRAHRNFEEFTVAHVSDELRETSFFLIIEAKAHNATSLSLSGQITNVIIRKWRSKRKDFIKPTELEIGSNPYSNVFGAEFSQSTATARFDLQELLDLASRAKILEVVITTSQGQRRCVGMGRKEVKKMFAHLR